MEDSLRFVLQSFTSCLWSMDLPAAARGFRDVIPAAMVPAFLAEAPVRIAGRQFRIVKQASRLSKHDMYHSSHQCQPRRFRCKDVASAVRPCNQLCLVQQTRAMRKVAALQIR